jgi:prevent-host-death family protein
MDDWTVAQAKAKLSEVIERAMSGTPQTITRHGKSAVVVVAAADWQRRTERKGTLADFLLASPLRESGLDLSHADRIKGGIRDGNVG